MENKKPKSADKIELPLQLYVSFSKAFAVFEKYTAKEYKEHPFHKSAKEMVGQLKDFPELVDGFSDFSLLKKYKPQIDLLLETLFPEALLNNEIKAASIPFSFTPFKFTTRFEDILKNAGSEYDFSVRNFDDDTMYIMACTFILGAVYGYQVDLKRPFYFDIPDKKTKIIKRYRAAFNGDFSEIIKTKEAPEITEEDYKELLDSFDNIEVWKEKFPPNSYIYKGFALINLFDVTADETISSIRTNLLHGGEDLLERLEKNFQEFYNINDLMLGFSVFEINKKKEKLKIKKSRSLLFDDYLEFSSTDVFCHYILNKVFGKHEAIALSDVEKYGEVQKNSFYKSLQKKGIQSIILMPIKSLNGNDLAVLEIASPRAYELNSINQNKLQDIIPSFKAAVERASEEHQNIMEATIQEHYTTIHETVKWRFYEAAEKYHNNSLKKDEQVVIDEIVFNEVYPLFGQSDIKGSSNARNNAIKEDLITQLTLAINVLDDACSLEKLPIYEELMFRVRSYLNDVTKGLNAGDEISILSFLKQDIYPVFRHIKEINKELSDKVALYMGRLDSKLHVVYEKRKDYESSVMLLNNSLADFLDKQQLQAQQMFPHYYERYKTDGVEFNMYIGQSLVKDRLFDTLYLYNLRLWQLQVIYQMENVAFLERKNIKHDLRVASLILVHSNPMAIKFRMDEKQFDVDGAYNIRYEIIKKRIDKAYIKGTQERLTVPGKIAIVYSQDKDAAEYAKYIAYMQSKDQLGEIEYLELEDLQGVSGLRALRVEVIYQKEFDQKKAITFKDLIKEIEA